MPVTPKQFSQKVYKKVLLYELDTRQELIFQIQLTGQGDITGIPTPVTPSYEARWQNISVNHVPKRPIFEPRRVLNKFLLNDGNVTERRVYIPYLPGTNEFIQHIRELVNYEGTECLDYSGEKHDTTIERFL
jgi:hypothetical protein